MTIAMTLYEIGQMLRLGRKNYITGPWNKLDLITCMLLLLWICFITPNYGAARISLSLAAIPLSLSLLQYLAVFKSLGQLVIMIVEMTQDFAIFSVVFFVAIFGFGIAFFGIFNGKNNFTTIGHTSLVLFSATLGNFDFNEFDGQTNFEIFGTVVMVVFVTLTGIILINLLIARMSSTHQRVESATAQEWCFLEVSNTNEYNILILFVND
jgi:NADH:ubiquinone oxidoreductase subunit K